MGFPDGRGPDGIFGVLLGIGWSITAFIGFLIWIAILILLGALPADRHPRREALPHAERPGRRGLPEAADPTGRTRSSAAHDRHARGEARDTRDETGPEAAQARELIAG